MGRLFPNYWPDRDRYFRWKKDKHKLRKGSILIELFDVHSFVIYKNLKKGVFFMSNRVLATQGTFHGHIEPKNSQGKDVAILDASEVYSSSDESIFTVAVDPSDPKKFIGTLTGTPGKANVLITIDPDASDAGHTETLNDELDIEVVADIATSINASLDDGIPDTTPATVGG